MVAIDVLQTLPMDELEEYKQLVKRLNMHYGLTHLDQVYQIQMKNHRQKNSESLKGFEAGAFCLFNRGWDNGCETERYLRLARPKTLTDELATALEFKPYKQVSRGQDSVPK